MRLGMVFYNEKKLSLYAGAVVRAVYSPKMFRRQADGPPEMAIALGSQDTKITVWYEGAQRPMVIGTKLFRCAHPAIVLCMSALLSKVSI